jgi:hypothetical protein
MESLFDWIQQCNCTNADPETKPVNCVFNPLLYEKEHSELNYPVFIQDDKLLFNSG